MPSGVMLPRRVTQTPSKGGTMDFSERLDALQQRVAATKSAVQAAAAESREQIGERIDQAQADVDRTMKEAQQRAERATDTARSKWAQMKSDAAAKRGHQGQGRQTD